MQGGSNQNRNENDRLAPRAIVFFPETSDQDVDEVMRNIQSVSESIRVLPLKFTEEDLRAFQGPQRMMLMGLAESTRCKLDERLSYM